MERPIQPPNNMDPKKLINEITPLNQAVTSQHQLDQLHRNLVGIQPDELEKIVNASRSSILGSDDSTAKLTEKLAIENAMGLTGRELDTAQKAADMMRAKFESSAGISSHALSEPQTIAEWIHSEIDEASGRLDGVHHLALQGITTIDFEDMEHQENERRQRTMSELAMAHSQRMVQDVAEHRAREDAKVEYARRSAEASEAALEAERQRTAAAQEDARAAREEARIARSHMRASLWIAAASLFVAAWTLIKDQPFW
ncbi:hypothetical protein RP29_06140 [Acidovorax temperans]|uniref:Uncharacterized protein n=1 Tax=Acidovorax temperans TaxID=80878 RepID=A0A0D7KBI9_9BURK|nr:hypothetical protein [Acidovorax temperans]KJA11302.1 hypothetical protein RP29_06140 [Acidovorax temperans]